MQRIKNKVTNMIFFVDIEVFFTSTSGVLEGVYVLIEARFYRIQTQIIKAVSRQMHQSHYRAWSSLLYETR